MSTLTEMTLVKVSPYTIRVIRRITEGFVVFDVSGEANGAFFQFKEDAIRYAKRPDWWKAHE